MFQEKNKMTKNICDSCERSRVSREYYPCQIPKVSRNYSECAAKISGGAFTYIPRPEIKTEEEIPKNKMKTKKEITRQEREQHLRTIRSEKLERDLEEACGMFGWEENDDFDRAIHAKNFIKACILKKVDPSNPEYNFKHIINLIERNPLLKKWEESHPRNLATERVYDSINDYLQFMKEGKLSGIERHNTTYYACEVMNRLNEFIPAF
jgi:hypothetical protein